MPRDRIAIIYGPGGKFDVFRVGPVHYVHNAQTGRRVGIPFRSENAAIQVARDLSGKRDPERFKR